ncbi:MAG: IMP dehydrogenase [Nanoarchaeota archaeon]
MVEPYTTRSKEDFFRYCHDNFLGLTFDDVLVVPWASEILPAQADLRTRLTRNISMKSPILSAAMDTVTESAMGIALAKAGGIGIIHKNMTVEEQAREVAHVKYCLHGFIEDPRTVYADQTMEEVMRWREEKGFKFHTFPVIDREERFVGILGRRDFSFCRDYSRTVSDEMTSDNLITAPKGSSVEAVWELMHENKMPIVPVIDEERRIVGLYVFSDIQRGKSKDAQNYNLDEKGRLRVGAAIGVGDDALSRLEMLVRKGVDVVVVDSAHGHSRNVIETIKDLVSSRLKVEIIAGNVSTYEGARALADAGADAIKVGQGPGSICTTRMVSGAGGPQLTAIYHAMSGACGIPVIADGGITYSGDITKAIAAGASSVMMGNVFAGTDESPGELILESGFPKWKLFRGMGSLSAMTAHAGSRERYGQQGKLVAEGVEATVPYKGPVQKTIDQFLGGLRAGMGYAGTETILELMESSYFIRVSPAAAAESRPHGVNVIGSTPAQ